MPTDTASAGPLEVPTTAGLPDADPSNHPVPKPELNDYVCLNFVKNKNKSKLKADDQATSANPEKGLPEPTVADRPRPLGASQGGEGINKRAEVSEGGANGNGHAEEETERVWRGSAIRFKSDRATSRKNSAGRRDGKKSNTSPEHRRPLECGDGNGTGTDEDGHDHGHVDDRDDNDDGGDSDDDDESKLYTRTLGSSVSVIDEKGAVARNGAARFVGEDPIRGRLRAADPFLWMGRLHAGAAAISILIDTAKSTLMGLDGSSTGGSTSAPNSIDSDQFTQGEVTPVPVVGAVTGDDSR